MVDDGERPETGGRHGLGTTPVACAPVASGVEFTHRAFVRQNHPHVMHRTNE